MTGSARNSSKILVLGDLCGVDEIATIRNGSMKRVAEYLETSPTMRVWVRLNQSVTMIALFVAIGGFSVAYLKLNEDRVKADEDRISKAWDTVTKMTGKGSNGGQVHAIEILVKNGVSLDRIDLRNTYLAGANLKGASMRAAHLSGADLSGANLQGVNLSNANLTGAKLDYAHLGGVVFDGARLSLARLAFAKVDIAVILAKSLKNTDLTGVRFVLEDEDGRNDLSMFNDTIAEAPSADEGQRRINQACANPKFGTPQDRFLPIKLPVRPCRYSAHYQSLKFQTYEYVGR